MEASLGSIEKMVKEKEKGESRKEGEKENLSHAFECSILASRLTPLYLPRLHLPRLVGAVKQITRTYVDFP